MRYRYDRTGKPIELEPGEVLYMDKNYYYVKPLSPERRYELEQLAEKIAVRDVL
jgi:hypothetical protein